MDMIKTMEVIINNIKRLWIRFWAYAGERALKTFGQAALALLIASGAEEIGLPLGILDIDWQTVLSVSGLAAIMSLLTSIVMKKNFHSGEGLFASQSKIVKGKNASL